jgi:hypothetical protein
MPSRKQRRRRAKERRHDYEYVYVDEEGNEVEVDPAELEAMDSRKVESRPRKSTAAGVRTIQPASWRRVARRGLLLSPLMFFTIHFFARLPSITAEVFQTAFLMAFFLPFSYLMDSLMYRRYMKRTGQEPAAGRR